MFQPPLLGTVVGVTAYGRSEEQALLLERRGAQVMLGTTIRHVPLGDGAVLGATAELIRKPPEVVLLSTDVGIRGWFGTADAYGRGEQLQQALAGADVVARGPKAAGAALSHGLRVTTRPQSERYRSLVAHVAEAHRSGVRVAVQLDGNNDCRLIEDLQAIGAEVVAVPVYRWTWPGDRQPARRLVEAVADLRVDAVTFTSSPAVENFTVMAAEAGLLDRVREAFAGPVIAACVGPVSAATAEAQGYNEILAPDRARLGPLVDALASRLSEPMRLRAAGLVVTLRRSNVVIEGRTVELSGREREVLSLLAARPTAVVSKAELLRAVWGRTGADEHTVEVTVARLRRRLGTAGIAIQTTNRRGYRLLAEPASDKR